MVQHVSAIFENGIFKPLGPVSSFAEFELVELTIAKKPLIPNSVPEAIRHMIVQPAILKTDVTPVTLDEIRAIFAKHPTTTEDDLREERERPY